MRLGLIGGSGLEGRLAEVVGLRGAERREVQTPFGAPSGPIVVAEAGGVPVAILQRHGEGHLIPPHRVPYRANMFAMKAFGVTHVVATGAVGSLREELAPGDLVVCDQLLDRTVGRERTFFDRAAVHVEFADPFCPVVREWLLAAATRAVPNGLVHARGTYVVIEGPSFSTRAESHMHRASGADVVGMTALPEARLAREAEIAYGLIALVTDYDSWRPPAPAEPGHMVLESVIANIGRATTAALDLLTAALARGGDLLSRPSPAHDALRLGIWSDRAAIAPEEIERLAPLWSGRL
jgi:5'-methylthioadenosine phosphorylase